MSDSIRARFSDSLELVTHVPIPAGEPETPVIYVVTVQQAWVGTTVNATILDDGEITSADIEIEAAPAGSDLSGLTAYKIIKGANNVLLYYADGWAGARIIDLETNQQVAIDYSTQYITADLEAGKTYLAMVEPASVG